MIIPWATGQPELPRTIWIGSFVVAALVEGRNFIGIELNKEIFDMAEERMKVLKIR